MGRALSIFALVALVFVSTPTKAEELVVSAAASLTDAFKDIEPAFEAEHPGVDVIMNFASSGALYRQIEQGAPVDVFASANPKWMDKAVDNGFARKESSQVFAQNTLVLAAPKGNPAGVASMADLTKDGVLLLGIGTPETVPAGQYAKAALTTAGLYEALAPKYIFCENVRQVLDYLTRGEVQAGFVYKTDAVRAGDSVVIVAEIPLSSPVAYPIAPLLGSGKPELAKHFVEFVLDEKGQALLESRGFKRP